MEAIDTFRDSIAIYLFNVIADNYVDSCLKVQATHPICGFMIWGVASRMKNRLYYRVEL